jgi:hypothetical protein
MPADRPLVSIVLLNYNQASVTCACLRSLRRLTYPRAEVIVVDNGSAGHDAALIRAVHPEVRVIANPTNDGFTGGNNVGMRAARGEYVFLLNNDTEVEPDVLDRLVEDLEAHPEAGMASPKIRYFDDPARIQYAGSTPVHPLTGRSHCHGWMQLDDGRFDASGPTALPHGAALLVRRTVLETVGLLADAFFIYYEELDFAARARRAGYGIRYVGGAVVYHKESMTVGKDSPLKARYMTRNRLLYLRRNVRGGAFVVAAAFFWLLALPKRLVRDLARGRFDLVRAALRGAAWHLRPRDVHAQSVLPPRPARPRPACPHPARPRGVAVGLLEG